jgi:CRISPR-associated protein Cmr6
MMETPNLGWQFYKNLYKTQDSNFSFDFLKQNPESREEKIKKEQILKTNATVLKERSQEFFDKKLSAYNPESFFKNEAATNSLELTTTYPGLLCGVGYNHGISSEADFKVGFYFDHTTGLPIVPGSSVKGVLRSAFPGYVGKEEDKRPSKEELKERYDFFRWLVEQTNLKINNPELKLPSFDDDYDIDNLEAFIFEGEDADGNQISYYKRDRFFDAYPKESLVHNGCFLKNDYITPHINRDKPEMSPFSNPTPLQFLKVLPKVKFCFQFQLKEGGGLSAAQKELLFKEILCFTGIGAKTNVGYGQFEEGFAVHRQEGNGTRQVSQEVARTEPQNYTGKLNIGEKLEAKVIDQSRKIVQIIVQGELFQVEMSGNCPEQGKLICVKINRLSKQREIQFVGFMGGVQN